MLQEKSRYGEVTDSYPPAGKDESPSLEEVSDSLERQREKVRRFHQSTKPKVLGEEMKRLLDKLGRRVPPPEDPEA